MGTLELKWGPNGDPKTEKGPHGDRVPQMGTHVGTVLKARKSLHPSIPMLQLLVGLLFPEIENCSGEIFSRKKLNLQIFHGF